MTMLARSMAALILAVAAGIWIGQASAVAAKPRLLVFAAASLKTALDAVMPICMAETGSAINISYAATSALAKQIEQGAPADLLLSADRDWVDTLVAKGLLQSGSVRELLGNEIVLIAPATATAKAMLAPSFDLAGLIGNGKLAMANVQAVPAGRYGKAGLTTLGLWDSVAGKVVQTENVRAALALVAHREAEFGIVYATDAKAEPKVRVLSRFPQDSHPPIIYPMALTRSARMGAERLADCLATDAAAEVFRAQGFLVRTSSKPKS